MVLEELDMYMLEINFNIILFIKFFLKWNMNEYKMRNGNVLRKKCKGNFYNLEMVKKIL